MHLPLQFIVHLSAFVGTLLLAIPLAVFSANYHSIASILVGQRQRVQRAVLRRKGKSCVRGRRGGAGSDDGGGWWR